MLYIEEQVDIVRESVESFNAKTISYIQKVEQDDDAEVWKPELLRLLRIADGVHRGSEIAKYYILSIFQDRWRELPKEWHDQYVSFENFAYVWANGPQSFGTIENNINAARIFLRGDLKISGTVEVPVRDENRKLIKDEAGTVETETIEWDITRATLSKLVLAAHKARTGELTQDKVLQTLLMDTGSRSADIRSHLYERKESTDVTNAQFLVEGDKIIYKKGGDEIEIGEFYADMYVNELGKAGILRLHKLMDVEPDEDFINRKMHEISMESVVQQAQENLDKLN